jgi:hypothetical protein
LARYQYLTVHMERVGSLNEGQPFVRVEKGAPRSSLREVLDEFAENGWRFVQFVPRGHAGTDQLVFERETA